MKRINKTGKTSPMTSIVVVALAAFLLIGLLVSGKLSPGTATVTPQAVNSAGQPVPPVVGISCPIQTTATVTGIDALVASTTATPTTVNYIVNGVYRGTSAPSLQAGDRISVIGDLLYYLAGTGEKTLGCGANDVPVSGLYAYANATVTVKDDPVTSSNTLTNNGGENNATASAAGGQRNFPVLFQGTSQKSSGKIFWVIETPAQSAANVSSISVTLNGAPLSPVTIPTGVTAVNAASTRVAFEVPAIIGAAQANANLQIQNAVSKTLKGVIINTFMAEQTFVNANGQVETGIYDSTPNGNNAAKYQDLYSYNISIQ